jgi:hypothetical protein
MQQIRCGYRKGTDSLDIVVEHVDVVSLWKRMLICLLGMWNGC